MFWKKKKQETTLNEKQQKQMKKALEFFGITEQEYMDRKMYDLSLFQILDMLSVVTDEEYIQALTRGMVSKFGFTEESARREIERTRKLTGFDYEYISNHALFMASDEELLQEKQVSAGRQSEYLAADGKKMFNFVNKRAKQAGENVVDFYRKKKIRCTEFGETQRNYIRLRHFERSDEAFGTFITCSDKFYLMRKYNGMANVEAGRDKFAFAKANEEFFGRKVWHSGINGTLQEFKDFAEGTDTIFVKPLAANQGQGAMKIQIDNNIEDVFSQLISMDSPVIAEHLIRQHPALSKLGAGSVNTFRVTTFAEDDKVNILYAVMKIGGNELVDNMHKGGVIAEVDLSTGTVISDGFTGDCTMVEGDPFQNAHIKGTVIPYWNEMLEMVKKVAVKVRDEEGLPFIGWDIAITEEGPIVVEHNSDPMLNMIEFIEPFKPTGRRELVERFLHD